MPPTRRNLAVDGLSTSGYMVTDFYKIMEIKQSPNIGISQSKRLGTGRKCAGKCMKITKLTAHMVHK